MAQKLTGIFTPNIVPLDARGEINEAELRRYVDWLIERGVHGLYPNGSTGEFTRFTAEERRRIIKSSVIRRRAACRCWPARRKQMCGNARGVRGCITPTGRGRWRSCRRFITGCRRRACTRISAEIARHSPIDVTLYNIPMFASPIDVPTIRRLAEFERVIGIKDSTGDMASCGG